MQHHWFFLEVTFLKFHFSLLPLRFPLWSICPDSRIKLVYHLHLSSVSVHLIPSLSTKALLFLFISVDFWENTQPFTHVTCPSCKDSVFRSISCKLDQGLAVGISEHLWSQLTSFGLFLPSFLDYSHLKQNQIIHWPRNTSLPVSSPMICRQLDSCQNRPEGDSAKIFVK